MAGAGCHHCPGVSSLTPVIYGNTSLKSARWVLTAGDAFSSFITQSCQSNILMGSDIKTDRKKETLSMCKTHLSLFKSHSEIADSKQIDRNKSIVSVLELIDKNDSVVSLCRPTLKYLWVFWQKHFVQIGHN